MERRLREVEEEEPSITSSSSESVALHVQRVAEVLSTETQRSLERLGTQLQQRRTELITALRSHLDSESERLSSLAVAPGGAEHSMATDLAMEALHDAASENRLLCERVQKVVGGSSGCTIRAMLWQPLSCTLDGWQLLRCHHPCSAPRWFCGGELAQTEGSWRSQ